jgi:hypothetical protein
VACAASDFISRVSGEIGSRGRMSTSGGTMAVPKAMAPGSDLRPTTAVQASPLEQAIHSMTPQNVSEADIEQLVQVITDQIMATAN